MMRSMRFRTPSYTKHLVKLLALTIRIFSQEANAQVGGNGNLNSGIDAQIVTTDQAAADCSATTNEGSAASQVIRIKLTSLDRVVVVRVPANEIARAYRPNPRNTPANITSPRMELSEVPRNGCSYLAVAIGGATGNRGQHRLFLTGISDGDGENNFYKPAFQMAKLREFASLFPDKRNGAIRIENPELLPSALKGFAEYYSHSFQPSVAWVLRHPDFRHIDSAAIACATNRWMPSDGRLNCVLQAAVSNFALFYSTRQQLVCSEIAAECITSSIQHLVAVDRELHSMLSE